jgi:hypothetical protein
MVAKSPDKGYILPQRTSYIKGEKKTMMNFGWDKVKGEKSWKDVQNGGGWNDIKGGESWKKGAWIIGGTGFIGALAYLRSWLAPRTDGVSAETVTAATTTSDFTIPTALWATPLVATAALAGAAAYKIWLELQKTQVIALRIKPKQGFTMDTERVGNMSRDFRTIYNKFAWRKRVWVKWQVIRNANKNYEFRLIVPADKKTKNKFTAYIKTCYPDVIITEEAPTLPDFFDPYDGEATHMKLADQDKTLGLQNDLGNEMGDILGMMTPKSIIEFTFSPSSGKDIRRAGRKRVRELELQEKKGADTRAEIAQVRTRYQGKVTAFDVFVDIWSYSGLEALASRISDRTERSNKLKGKPYYQLEEYRNPIQYETHKRVLARWQANKLTDKELSSFLMLPPDDHPVWEFIETERVKPPVTASDFNGDIALGYIDSDNPEQNGRAARLQIKTFCNHGLIAGAAGGGKGSALSMLFKMDFLKQWAEGKPDSMGATVCDPHNLLNLLIISYLLDMERQGVKVPWDRVKVVSFGKLGAEKYPVAMNLLHRIPGHDVDATATALQEVILSAFDSSGMSKGVSDLQRAIQALMCDPDASILDIVRLFQYKPSSNEHRERLILSAENDVVAEWLDDLHRKIKKKKEDVGVTSVDARLSQLVTKKSIQRFHLREGNYFDVDKILANGDLVLIDFLEAQPESYKLIAGWLSSQYYNRAQARGAGKRPHILIFDEVQKFKVESIYTSIIRENRKFNCGLVLSTQQPDRLDQELTETITSNAGFVLSVRQEAGAAKMQKLLGAPFAGEELNQLEKGLEAAVKSDDGKARLKLEYPQFLLKGVPTWKDSKEEEQAIQIAEQKFLELLARDHKTAKEADEEVSNYVYRSQGTPITAEEMIAAAKEDNVVPMEQAVGAEQSTVRKKRRKI